MKHTSLIPSLCIVFLITACSASSVSTVPSALGQQANTQSLLSVADQAGPIEFEKHIAANWQVPLSGMLNLNHPKAIAADLRDREEEIQLYIYVIRHPEHGTYFIDSGISTNFLDAENNTDVSLLVKSVMSTDKLEVVKTTKDLLLENNKPVQGVFLTHIHMDHILGLNDLSSNIPVYIGPGDAASKSLEHLATRGTTDRLLKNVSSLQEWQFGDAGLIDVFADGSLWAIHAPGHSPGHTVYLVRSTNGPQLVVGDASHTRWGWDNLVEPGTYSKDALKGIDSLQRLKTLALENTNITVHPGHQQ